MTASQSAEANIDAADAANQPLSRAGLAAALALAALADWLFYGRHHIGISLVAFVLATALGVSLANPVRGSSHAVVAGVAVLLACLAPFAMTPSILAGIFAIFGLGMFAAMIASNAGSTLTQRAIAACSLLRDCGWRIYGDVGSELMRPRTASTAYKNALAAWALPIVLGSVFVALFASANPLIAVWLEAINPAAVMDRLSLPRLAFWLIAASIVWPFVFVRLNQASGNGNAAPKSSPAPNDKPAKSSLFFGHDAILRSLIVFNGLFAVQSVLDATYLWGGVELPAGMSHADYAHRGAYPLIATALLAAVFVIVAMRPGSEAERSPLVRALVYLWVAQNVLLVISSILRLDLYVENYSLTRWRIAAFVWMVLVAIGLVLILARIALDRPTSWLIRANVVSLTLVLYVCAHLDFPAIISDYNVRHSAELTQTGSVLDRGYLLRLGEAAIPAVDLLLARGSLSEDARQALQRWRAEKVDALRRKLGDWRAWSYRDWAMERYIARTLSPQSGLPAG